MAKPSATGSSLYFFGFLGTAIYFISNASSFWIGALGVLKAMVWPAVLAYELLKLAGA